MFLFCKREVDQNIYKVDILIEALF